MALDAFQIGRTRGVAAVGETGTTSMDSVTSYPLTGIRAATTDAQQILLQRALAVLRSDDRVLADWLVGSFATGEADPFSDLDLHCCVTDAAAELFSGDGWKEVLHQITPTVMATMGVGRRAPSAQALVSKTKPAEAG